MRVRRTPVGGVEAGRNRRRQCFKEAIAVGVLSTLMTTFLFSDLEWLTERHMFVPLDEIPHRLAFSVLCGFGAGLFYWWLRRREK
jgi:hypothetical protein